MTSVRMKWWSEVRSDWQGFSLLEMLLVAFYVSVLFAETVVWICSLCLRVWRGYDCVRKTGKRERRIFVLRVPPLSPAQHLLNTYYNEVVSYSNNQSIRLVFPHLIRHSD